MSKLTEYLIESQTKAMAVRPQVGGFPEFLMSMWKAGVVSYEVDFFAHTVAYFGAAGEKYIEQYPMVEIQK